MDLLRDLRHATRSLARSPGFTLLAVLVLALGLGAATSVFGIVRSVLLRPLSYEDPERLVAVFATEADGAEPRNPTSPADVRDWRRSSRTLETITAAHPWAPTLTGVDVPDQLSGLKASPSLFELLGVDAVVGRTFAPGDGTQVVVLGHDLWHRRFGGDPEVVGRPLLLDGEGHTVLGVMPEGFRFPPFWAADAELWTPLVLPPEGEASRQARFLRVFARLAPGATVAAAQQEMSAVARRLAERYPEANEGVGANVEPLREPVVAGSRRALVTLLAAVGFVLLIACVNVANLLLARMHRRRSEVALRAALGAPRSALVREVLAESALLAAGGCAGGIFLAWLGLEAVRVVVPAGRLPRVQEIGLDAGVVAFAVAAAAAAALVAGVLPALRATRRDPQELLRTAGRGTRGSRDLLRPGLVVAEVALALVLLAGAGLMVRSFTGLLRLDPGFRTEGVLTAGLPLAGSPHEEADAQARFLERAAGRVTALPGVRSAAFVNHLPVGGDLWRSPFAVEGAEHLEQDRPAAVRTATPGYFETLGIPVLRGRAFDGSERPDGRRVVVVNRTLERLLRNRLPAGTDPLGARIKLGGPGSDDPWATVIGVVGDARQEHLTDPVRPEVTFPYAQNPFPWYTTATLVALPADGTDPRALAGPIRSAIGDLDATVPVVRLRSMEEILGGERAAARFHAQLLGAFALFALLLAAVGLYGVIAFLVGERRPELAVRLALGARGGDVVRLVLGHGALLTALGLGAGLAGVLLLEGLLRRLLGDLLYRIEPGDPATLAAASGLLAAVALLACAGPAVRAARVPPSETLRRG